jgi:hypothetical protein
MIDLVAAKPPGPDRGQFLNRALISIAITHNWQSVDPKRGIGI